MAAISQIENKILAPVVGASETDLPLMEFSANAGSSKNLRADMVCSGVTVAAGITVKLQHQAKGGDYEDLATGNAVVAISGNGTFSIVLHVQRAADQADLPLRKSCRLVVTTGAGDAVTFEGVSVQQP